MPQLSCRIKVLNEPVQHPWPLWGSDDILSQVVRHRSRHRFSVREVVAMIDNLFLR
jgi:hypothetical protein